MPFLESLLTIVALGFSWLLLPLLIPAALVIALVFLIWHGVPKFSWHPPEPSAEPRQ